MIIYISIYRLQLFMTCWDSSRNCKSCTYS